MIVYPLNRLPFFVGVTDQLLDRDYSTQRMHGVQQEPNKVPAFGN